MPNTMPLKETPRSVPHGPKRAPFFGNLNAARKDILGLLTSARNDFGDVVELKFGMYRYVVLNDVDAIHHVLVSNHKNYVKSETYEGLKLILGQGLLTSEGDFWRRQRKLAQPAFHKERLHTFSSQMARLTAEMVDRWKTEGVSSVDMHREMMRLTLRIVGMTLFSTDIDHEAKRVGEAMTFATHYMNDFIQSLIKTPLWLPTQKNRQFIKARETLNQLVLSIIQERRRAGDSPHKDLLGMFMAAVGDSDDDRMNDTQLRDEVMTVVLAGHETTANLLSFAFFALCQHPEIAERVRAEVTDVVGDRIPTLDDLPKLKYTTRVLEETLRFYPPAWIFEKQALGPDTVGGYRIDPKTILAISPYTMHRHPKYWENPETFDPDRFLPERSEGRPKFAYIPFGGGPRFCIGNAFAMMEAQIIVAMVMRHFTLSNVNSAVEIEPLVTLRPKGGLPMRVAARA